MMTKISCGSSTINRKGLLSLALLSLIIATFSISNAKYAVILQSNICSGGYCLAVSDDAKNGSSYNLENRSDTIANSETNKNVSSSKNLYMKTKNKHAHQRSNKRRTRTKSLLSTKSTVSKNTKASRDCGEDDSILSSLADEVKDVLRSAGALGGRVMKSTLKGAVGLMSNKQVSLSQVLGKWRLYQEIRLPGGNTLSYPVAIELLSDGTVVSSFNDEEFTSRFEFKERPWPKKCSISFSIPSASFDTKTSSDRNSIRPPNAVLHYKGSFKVSLLNRKVVLMRGSVYKSAKKLFNWKTKQKCGRFKGTKRRYS